jgi:hypothetical protein
MVTPSLIPFQQTDPSQWRLHVKHGRQLWSYIDSSTSTLHGVDDGDPSRSEKRNNEQSVCEKYWLGQLKVSCFL